MLLHCWLMLNLLTMLEKQPTDAGFISPKHFVFFTPSNTAIWSDWRVVASEPAAALISRDRICHHITLYFCWNVSSICSTNPASSCATNANLHISKKKCYLLTNPASSYQSRSRLGSNYTSVWPNCSVCWTLLLGPIKRPTPLTQDGFPIMQNSLTKSSQRKPLYY